MRTFAFVLVLAGLGTALPFATRASEAPRPAGAEKLLLGFERTELEKHGAFKNNGELETWRPARSRPHPAPVAKRNARPLGPGVPSASLLREGRGQDRSR